MKIRRALGRGRGRRAWLVVAALALLTPAVLAVGVPTAAATDHGDDGGNGGNGGVAAIGLDATTPANHNFGYNDFFPRDGVRIHSGDVVDFGWRQNLDGLHNVAVLQTGKTPDQGRAQYPTVIPDEDGPGSLQLNPAANLGNHPPAGSGAPGACGDSTTPCVVRRFVRCDRGRQRDRRVAPFRREGRRGRRLDGPFICLIHLG